MTPCHFLKFIVIISLFSRFSFESHGQDQNSEKFKIFPQNLNGVNEFYAKTIIYSEKTEIVNKYVEQASYIPYDDIAFILKELKRISEADKQLTSSYEKLLLKYSDLSNENANLSHALETTKGLLRDFRDSIQLTKLIDQKIIDSLLTVINFGDQRIETTKGLVFDFKIAKKEAISIKISLNRNQAKEHKYIFTSDFSGGMARVYNGQKYGFVNSHGELTIHCRFDDAGEFANQVAPVKVGRIWHFIRENGTRVSYLPDSLSTANSFINKRSLISNSEGLFFFIDKSGGKIESLKSFNSIEVLDDNNYFYGCIRSNKKNYWGIISWSSGEEIVPISYDSINYTNGYFILTKGNIQSLVKYGEFDKIIFSGVYKITPTIINKMVPVSNGTRWAYYNLKIDDWSCNFKYEGARPFFGDLGIVRLNGKYGAIDQYDNEVIPIKFSSLYYKRNLIIGKIESYRYLLTAHTYPKVRFKSDGHCKFRCWKLEK